MIAIEIIIMNKEPEIFPALVTSIVQATKRIKTFRLNYGDRPYTFRPGQWIDLFGPNGIGIGGYTITSSIKDKGFIDLAIRESTSHPVTKYLHENVQVGDEVMITEGQGKFFLTPELMNTSLTLIAGGIGITPLLSMFRSVDKELVPVKVFYSVSSDEDILFKEELSPFTIFTVTKSPTPDWSGETSRINLEFLQKYQCDFNSHFFICGPRPLIDGLTKELLDYGVSKDRIHYEKWW